MVQNNSMADIIYDYFTSRILFGYYLFGDRLPSISDICRQFQVSALTVRTALIRMREEGYLETTERKRCLLYTSHPVSIRRRMRFQELRHVLDYPVSIFVAEAVVDFFHAVDVDIDHAKGEMCIRDSLYWPHSGAEQS